MNNLTIAGRCAFCRGIGHHTEDPHGWIHPQPVCEKFKAAVTVPMSGIRALPDGSGWEVIPSDE